MLGQKQNSTIKFAVLTDIHFGRGPRIFDEAVDLCNDLTLDFVLFLGDLIQDPSVTTTTTFIDLVKKIKKPVYFALENMEIRIDLREKLRSTFPGPWSDSFTFAFQEKEWRFVVVGGIVYHQTPLSNFYVNQYKGFIDRKGNLMYLAEEHRRRFKSLLEESHDTYTCLVMHVPVIPIAKRLHKRGVRDCIRLIEEPQIRSLIEEHKDVRLILSGHQHFNQVTIAKDQLHCVTQNLKGTVLDEDDSAVRLMELSRNRIKSTLIWHGRQEEPPSPIGTLSGDRSFEWYFTSR